MDKEDKLLVWKYFAPPKENQFASCCKQLIEQCAPSNADNDYYVFLICFVVGVK